MSANLQTPAPTLMPHTTTILDRIVGTLPDTIRVGETVTLTLNLTRRAVKATDRLSSATIVDHDGIDILLLLQAPGFITVQTQNGTPPSNLSSGLSSNLSSGPPSGPPSDQEPGSMRTVHIPADADPPPVRFQLVAMGPGTRTIEVSAYDGHQYVGGLQWTRTITAVPPIPTPAPDAVAAITASALPSAGFAQTAASVPMTATAAAPETRQPQLQPQLQPQSQSQSQPQPQSEFGELKPRKPDKYDVTVIIRRDPNSSYIRFQLHNGLYISEEAFSPPLLRPTDEAINSLVNQLNRFARGKEQLSDAGVRRWLKNQGIALWNEFVPRSVQEQFWQMRDHIRRLIVVTADDPIPWELMYPFKPGGYDAGFLVEQFPVARWRAIGRNAPRRLSLERPCYVLPAKTDAPPSAEDEIEEISRIVGTQDGEAGVVVRDLAGLLNRFDAANFTLLHIASHNDFAADDPDKTSINLGTPAFELAYLHQYTDCFNAGEAGPIIFMNACRTDAEAPLYTRVSGWANSFLDAGAGAFIGSLWEVRDTSARTFAGTFYRALLAGANLGDAFTVARDAIKSVPGDPTWLAYSLYGDPSATLAPPHPGHLITPSSPDASAGVPAKNGQGE